MVSGIKIKVIRMFTYFSYEQLNIFKMLNYINTTNEVHSEIVSFEYDE